MKIRNYLDLRKAIQIRGVEEDPDTAAIWFMCSWDAEHVFGEMSAKDLATALLSGVGAYNQMSPEEADEWISDWRDACVLDETDEEDEGDSLLNEALDSHFGIQRERIDEINLHRLQCDHPALPLNTTEPEIRRHEALIAEHAPYGNDPWAQGS